MVGQRGELRNPEAGLHGKEQHGVITSADPPAAVWSRQEGIDLAAVEESHDGTVVALGWHRQHPLDEGGVVGMP